ncbi:MAG: sigma-70 family RNA polymerase sigma factor [Halieaceae bacterium]
MTDEKDEFLRNLVAEHQTPLERFLTRKLDNPEDAAEVAQEAYLRLHRMENPQQLDNARAFLYQVASNLAVDQLRRRTLHFRFLKTEKSQLPEGEPQDASAVTASPEQILAAREKLKMMFEAVDELPFKVKQAFLLHRRSGMSYAEIAQALGVSVSSVEKYLLQALKHCRKRLSQHYPTE